jgi:hypothetical protein
VVAALETYAQQYRRHVRPRFGHRALAEITGLELSDFAPPPARSRARAVECVRHTHKNMLIELDVPEIAQDERLGHRPPGMRAVYAHATPDMRKHMIDGLERVWDNEGKPHFKSQILRPSARRFATT